LAFNFGLSFKYVLFKPLIWLGTLALLLRLRVKQRNQERIMLAFQMGLFIFFGMTAGYDRMGFLLAFIPAIYVAEFLPFLWEELSRQPKLRRLRQVGFVLLLIAIFSQQSLPIMIGRTAAEGGSNKAELEVTDAMAAHPEITWWIFDQQIMPFVHEGQHWRLIPIVPSAGRSCIYDGHAVYPGHFEGIVSGPYAQTEYKQCIPWMQMDTIWSSEDKAWMLLLPKE
jgi:hypothetical protein